MEGIFDYLADYIGEEATSTATEATIDATVSDSIFDIVSDGDVGMAAPTDSFNWSDAKDVGKAVFGAGVKTFGGADSAGVKGVSRRPQSIGLNLNSTDRLSNASMPAPAKTSSYDDFYSQWTSRMRGLAGK